MVRCAKCRIELPQDSTGKACHECGEIGREIVRIVNEKNKIVERLRGRGRGYKIRKNRLSVNLFFGHDLFKKTGKWNMLYRLFDVINNRYREKIYDPDTGEVFKDVDEPLSAHTGHGSAKKKRKL